MEVKMDYELYTVPRCDGCEAVKQLLNQKGIQYGVFNLRDPEHKKHYGKIYIQIDGKIKRNLKDNYALLPLLVEVDEFRNVKNFAQRLEEITNLLIKK